MAAKKKPNGRTTARVTIQLETPPDTPNYYINHAEISHTPHDFCIAVARIPGKLPPSQRDSAMTSGVLSIEAMLTLTIPKSLMAGLIQALQKQLDTVEAKDRTALSNQREDDDDTSGKRRVRH